MELDTPPLFWWAVLPTRSVAEVRDGSAVELETGQAQGGPGRPLMGDRRPTGLRRMPGMREEAEAAPQGIRRLPGLLADLCAVHGRALEVSRLVPKMSVT